MPRQKEAEEQETQPLEQSRVTFARSERQLEKSRFLPRMHLVTPLPEGLATGEGQWDVLREENPLIPPMLWVLGNCASPPPRTSRKPSLQGPHQQEQAGISGQGQQASGFKTRRRRVTWVRARNKGEGEASGKGPQMGRQLPPPFPRRVLSDHPFFLDQDRWVGGGDEELFLSTSSPPWARDTCAAPCVQPLSAPPTAADQHV